MRVGFVGLGDMGKPMAERLARCSPCALSVFDTRPEQAEDAVKLGAVAARSLGDLAERSDLIEIVVRTTEQVQEVVLGPEGILAGAASGSVIAVHSTVAPGALREIAQRCAARGVDLLDVAVSGGAPSAGQGSLTFMAGGDPAVLERCRPIFEVMAGAIFHLGGIGAGQAGKLVNNLLYNIAVVSAAECMRLAVAAGIPEETAIELLRASAGNSYVIQHWERCMKHGPGDGARLSALRHKDVGLALDLARALDVETPLGACAASRIDWALGMGDGISA